MALVQYLFEDGTQDLAMTNANSGSSTSSLTGTSTTTFDAGMKGHGNFGMKVACSAGAQAFRRFLFAGAAATTVFEFSILITLPSAAIGNTVLAMKFGDSANNGLFTIRIPTAATSITANDNPSSHTATLATGLTPGSKYRVAGRISGGSTTASTVVFEVYADSGGGVYDAQVGTTYSASNWNLTTANCNRVDVGVTANSAAAVTLGIDDLQLNDGANTGMIPDYVASVPLDTPVVSLTHTDPTTHNGTDGTITATWDAITGADHYESCILTGSQTTGFTADDTNATSPKTYTGLAAGTYTVAVVAKA